MNKDFEYVVNQTSKDLGVDKDIVRNVYKSVWLFIMEDAKLTDIKNNPNNANSYSIYKLGKIYANKLATKKLEYDKHFKDQTDGQSDCDDC